MNHIDDSSFESLKTRALSPQRSNFLEQDLLAADRIDDAKRKLHRAHRVAMMDAAAVTGYSLGNRSVLPQSPIEGPVGNVVRPRSNVHGERAQQASPPPMVIHRELDHALNSFAQTRLVRESR